MTGGDARKLLLLGFGLLTKQAAKAADGEHVISK